MTGRTASPSKLPGSSKNAHGAEAALGGVVLPNDHRQRGDSLMDRRTFIDMVAGSLLVASLPALAQQTGKVRRIGILTAGTIPSDSPFFVELRERGWIEDQNLLIERRAAGGKAELVPGLAAELVQLKVDVIVTSGAVASVAAKNATTTIPLVTATGDPLRIGLVASMSRPGGNITGLSTVATELSAKRLELVRELLPTATRVGTLGTPANPHGRLVRRTTRRPTAHSECSRFLSMWPMLPSSRESLRKSPG